MTALYKAEFGITDMFQIDEKGLPSIDEWADEDGWALVGVKPQPAPGPLDEATYRQRVKESWKAQYGEDIEDTALDEMVNRNRAAGKISGTVTAPAAEPGVMSAVAADAEPGTGEFAGGAPQGQPGALAEAEEVASPDTGYARMGQAMEAERVASAQRDTIQDRLLKHRAKAAKSARQVGRKAAKKDADKAQKAATKVEAALKKGNIRQVSKDNLKIALNNQSFVDGLTEEELRTLLDYLEQ